MNNLQNFENERKRVLLVEDNIDHSRLMEIMMKKHQPDVDVIVARSGIECFQVLDKKHVDIIVLDYELPMMSGLEILTQIQERKLKAPVIVVTGKGDENIAVQAMKKGAHDYIVKDKGYMYVLPRVIIQTLEKYALQMKLFESERKYQTLFDSFKDVISVQDHDLTITLANDIAAQMSRTPVDKLVGEKCYEKYFDRTKPCEDCPVLKTFKTGQIHHLEKTHNKEIFSIRSHPIFDIHGKLINVIEVGQIITEQKRLEKQIIQSEKLATIGLLSSGIAHELRNPLNIIETARYFISDTYGDTVSGLNDKLEIIHKNVTRASTIINNLLEFSRQSDVEREAIDIHTLIDKTLSLIGKELVSKNIDLNKSYEKIPPVFFNLDSLKQVLLNIIINAIQAMPNGGILGIRTQQNKDNTVSVEIQDTGSGIAQKDLPHIFSPFFTTKEVGVGTGLGLYISHTIMQREGGEILVESEEGVGSTFIIKLPVVETTRG
ncbi:response regulator [candidate division KSB1 bacterium]|nr:response regulator [candidate division KSB1 bacterium]